MNLRDEIQTYIHRAIDSSKGYVGQEYDLNQHTWEQITTDRIIHALIRSLPEPVNLRQKYETVLPDGTLPTDPENPSEIEQLAQYADDNGYNRYRRELVFFFESLYKPRNDVVSSNYDNSEAKPIHRSDSDAEAGDKEPVHS